MWKFALLFVLVHGASCIAPGAYWVLETLKCSEHRVVVEPNKNLMETPEALDQMCKQQREFYHCLEIMMGLQGLDATAELPSEIHHERAIFNDLCSEDSGWRLRYLKFAPCINSQQTDFCKTQEFLNADTGDNSPCALQEKMVNCIAATLTMKCGIGAGYLFHHLTKLTKDDCQSETISSCQDSEFACKGNDSKAKEFDEIYDQLFKRMGHIPDQDDSSLLQEEDSSTEESLDFEGETIADSLDFQVEAPLLDSSDVENEIPVFLVNTVDDPDQENVIAVDYDSMSELITSALNELDENSETDSTESTDLIYKINEKNRENPEIAIEYSDTDSAAISSTVPSELKEYYEEITTMDTEDNYSKIRIFPDGRINYYRKNTAFTPIESVECRHFPEYFRCVSMHRRQNLQCLEQLDYTKPTSDEFFPEEIDPEFGAELHETLPKRRYIFKQWLDQSKDDSDSQSCSSTSDSEDTRSNYISDSQNVHSIKDVEDEAYSETEDVCSTRNVYSENNWSATESENALKLKTLVLSSLSESDLSHNMIQDTDASESTEENELENVSKLFSIFTAAWPRILRVKEIDLLPKDIADTMEYLFTYKTGLLRNARLDMDDFGNFYMYWANQQSLPIDTITCGRVNECHPKSEGVWKCVILPREAEGKADGSTASTEQTY